MTDQDSRPIAPPRSPHSKTVGEVASDLATDTDLGLTQEDARKRLLSFGPNRIQTDTGPSRWQLFGRQFKNTLVLVLLVAAAISGLLLGDWLEAVVIAAIVIINAGIGFTQEARAAEAAESLQRLTAPTGKVVRSGRELEVRSDEIVPGDLVLVEAGDRVMADARLLEVGRLAVDESELTGESTPVEKSTDQVAEESSIGDRSGMIFSGTTVISGRALGVVTATGPTTEMGKIAVLLSEVEPPTPLERELEIVGRRLGLIAVAVALVVLVVGVAQGRALESMFLLAVALAVAAIPEGLPAVVGVTLGLGVQRMARRNAIVRRITAVEALGAVTVICTDKTGTLTRNMMSVQRIRLGTTRVADMPSAIEMPLAKRFSQLAALCNDARAEGDGLRGDPTEISLLDAVAPIRDPAMTRFSFPRIDEIPFDSSRKWMATLHTAESGLLLAVKGAPEALAPLCEQIDTEQGPVPFTDAACDEWLAAAEAMATSGLRTLALAYRKLQDSPQDLEEATQNLVMNALVGISDELRDEALPSVTEATEAGVRVIMITGDHKSTATAIGGQLGLLEAGNVVTGTELRRLDEAQLDLPVDQVSVYARVDPEDKVRIVRAWQSRGEIVAMTGDGVNDAPSLRIADIGVSMGSGTDVARDASDLVLVDDNFATIVAAVREGRTIFSNIRKVIAFLLAANVSEVIVVFIGFLLFGALGDPLLATQILWVNLITDGLPAIALGFDPPDSMTMHRPPGKSRSLLGRRTQAAIAIRGALLAAFVLAAFGYGIVLDEPWEVTRTLGFTVLVLVQLAFVYALRVSESGWREGLTTNPILHGAVASSLLLQVAVVATPIGNRLFETVPLTGPHWVFVVVLALASGLSVIFSKSLVPTGSSPPD